MIKTLAAALRRPLGRNVHVVYDLGGAGRVLGVFRRRECAQRLCALNPGYYKLTTCTLDRLTDAGLGWAGPAERERLEAAIR